MADLDLVAQIGAANQGLAIVSVVRPDGSIHSSLVNAGVLEHPVTGSRVVGCVLGGAARKLAYLRRARPGALAFQHGWPLVSVDGSIAITRPDHTAVVTAGGVSVLL